MNTTRLAVIDLGSNTFHLLIVDIQPDGSWTPLAKDRRYVKLASGGLEVISPDSIERAIQVIKEFAFQIQDLQVEKIFAIGTAALREAKNGLEVAQMLTTASGIAIDIIDGHREAEYILKGIQSVMPFSDQPCLIMDIGGGSVEFILFKNHTLLFAQSFKIGVAVLFRQFHHEDPISEQHINALEHHLQTELKPVLAKLDEITEYYLIGASGSFEVIRDVMPKLQQEKHWSALDFKALNAYMSEVIQSDLASRKQRPEIPVERLDYIVVAYILIRFIMRSKPPSKLLYCDFALKEGVIAENS